MALFNAQRKIKVDLGNFFFTLKTLISPIKRYHTGAEVIALLSVSQFAPLEEPLKVI